MASAAQAASNIGIEAANGKQRERHREEEETASGQRRFAKHFHQPADEPALQDHADDSDKAKEVARLARVETELLFGEEREERRHDGEAGDREKISGHDRAEHARVAVLENIRQASPLLRMGAILGGKTFREDEIKEHDIHRREPGRKIERRAVGDVAHDPADHRAKGEPKAKSRADDPHRTRTIFRGADIGDVRLRGRDVATGNAVDDARDKEERERIGPAHDEKTERGPGQTNDQDRAPPDAVGEPAEDGGKDDLHPGIDASEPADLERGGIEMLRVKRQHRDDDAEPHHVDEDGEKDEEERRHGKWRVTSDE